ncbi:MAG: aminopeptidase P family protein [Alphaproteobacteria bacterium]
MFKQRLLTFRKEILKYGLDGFIIPSNDEFQSEYTPNYAKRLYYLTGFTGSNGIALITHDQAILFTDGRYLLQAQYEIDTENYQIIDISKEDILAWLKKNLDRNYRIGFDPKLHTEKLISLGENYCQLIATDNLVDKIWQDKPLKPQSKILLHAEKYTGESSNSKILKILNYLNSQKIDALILTDPQSICWLLNIRGEDIPYTPLILCYAIIYSNGRILLFSDTADIINAPPVDIEILPFKSLEQKLNFQYKNVQIDKQNAPIWFIENIRKINANIVDKPDPCIMLKACKNQVEIKNAKTAHLKDGASICKFLYWLENQEQDYSELELISKLEEFRLQDKDYISPSFDTICGFNKNGAIIHYKATEKTNQIIRGNGLLLIDSGGQYYYGTTDVTRTIAIGKSTPLQKEHFTRVLKGHIVISQARFPKNTTGSQLDALARYNLWQVGLDYGHGTGHGVGSYLSVHEGPQRISKAPNSTPLLPGMILSNEPGYYEEGEYGIRIENLLYVKESKYSNFLKFKDLTLVPIDYKLIDSELLNEKDKLWLSNYHNTIYEKLTKYLKNSDVINWLDSYRKFYNNL